MTGQPLKATLSLTCFSLSSSSRGSEPPTGTGEGPLSRGLTLGQTQPHASCHLILSPGHPGTRRHPPGLTAGETEACGSLPPGGCYRPVVRRALSECKPGSCALSLQRNPTTPPLRALQRARGTTPAPPARGCWGASLVPPAVRGSLRRPPSRHPRPSGPGLADPSAYCMWEPCQAQGLSFPQWRLPEGRACLWASHPGGPDHTPLQGACHRLTQAGDLGHTGKWPNHRAACG